MHPNNMNSFSQMEGFTNISPKKIEMIEHLKQQNNVLQNQIIMNNNIIQKLCNEQKPENIFYFNYGRLINIKFEIINGLTVILTVILNVKENIQMKNLLKEFMSRLHKESNLFDNDIIFSYNATMISKHDTRNIANLGIGDNSVIRVIDQNNKIGTYLFL